MTSTTQVKKKNDVSIKWKVAAVLPTSDGQMKSLGFAGPINGVNNNVFIIAGGANFPNGLPWEGGKKYYSNEIFVLQKEDNKFVWNKKVKKSLTAPIAYCGVTSTDKGIVYAGGENETGISKKAWLLNWDSEDENIEIKPLPDLPLALTSVALAHIDNMVFAAGGDKAKGSSKTFFSLDLNAKNAEWKALPDLPIALANATLIAQKNGVEKSIYLIGGRTKTASGISELHHTTFVFDLNKNEWKKCADISDGTNISNLSAAAGIAISKNYILMIGGDNGTVFHKIETYISEISKAGSEEEKEKLTREKNALSIYHDGFYKGLLLYHTKLDKWEKIGEYPYPAQVTTTAVKWGNDIVVSNG
ncbi:MAG TPA: kelch repeat-containing protein [Hanamia sp.]|nr:kelch repeat-containing protein [Hanamia sp.]